MSFASRRASFSVLTIKSQDKASDGLADDSPENSHLSNDEWNGFASSDESGYEQASRANPFASSSAEGQDGEFAACIWSALAELR